MVGHKLNDEEIDSFDENHPAETLRSLALKRNEDVDQLVKTLKFDPSMVDIQAKTVLLAKTHDASTPNNQTGIAAQGTYQLQQTNDE